MFVCPADLEAEADRIFASHAQWMQRTHHRDGDKALLQDTLTKGRGRASNSARFAANRRTWFWHGRRWSQSDVVAVASGDPDAKGLQCRGVAVAAGES
jgi:hypothetical protein